MEEKKKRMGTYTLVQRTERRKDIWGFERILIERKRVKLVMYCETICLE